MVFFFNWFAQDFFSSLLSYYLSIVTVNGSVSESFMIKIVFRFVFHSFVLAFSWHLLSFRTSMSRIDVNFSKLKSTYDIMGWYFLIWYYEQNASERFLMYACLCAFFESLLFLFHIFYPFWYSDIIFLFQYFTSIFLSPCIRFLVCLCAFSSNLRVEFLIFNFYFREVSSVYIASTCSVFLWVSLLSHISLIILLCVFFDLFPAFFFFFWSFHPSIYFSALFF